MMATKLGRYPKLISANLDEYGTAAADSKSASKSSSNKNFFYIISFFLTLVFAAFIFVLGSLDEASIEVLSRFLDSVPYFDLKLSPTIFHELRFPGPVSNTLFAGNIAFLSFILFDIFRNQEKAKQANGDLFKESSSVSYTIHLAILLWILLSVLVTYKPRPKVQVSRIEFIVQSQGAQTKKTTDTKRKSDKTAKDSGKHDPTKPVNPASKPKAKPGLPPKAKPKAASKPKPKSPSPAKASPKPSPPKISKVIPKHRPLIPRPKVLREAVHDIDEINPDAKTLPKLLDYTPNSDSAATNHSSSPAPKTSEQSGGPESRSSNLVARLSSIPRAPDSLAGSGQGGGMGAEANAAPNHSPGGPVSIAANASVNFGPYMSALQRKVKMSWKPPRGTESNRIIAKFTINPDGTLSNLTLVQKSVFPGANVAAIEAITKASPFGRLPGQATEPIEIEFSFDYTTSQRLRY